MHCESEGSIPSNSTNTMNSKIIKLVVSLGYKIDKSGFVISPKTNKQIGYIRHNKMYRYFSAGGTGNRTYPVPFHRLQAYQKYGEAIFEPGICVRHLNGDSLDNSWDNIVIGTHQDNMLDKCPIIRQESALSAARSQRKLSWEEVAKLKKERDSGDSLKILSKRYGLAMSTVSYIINNKTYNIE